jgi:hypothetical protein
MDIVFKPSDSDYQEGFAAVFPMFLVIAPALCDCKSCYVCLIYL